MKPNRLNDYFCVRLSVDDRNYIDSVAKKCCTSSGEVLRTMIHAYKKANERVKYDAKIG